MIFFFFFLICRSARELYPLLWKAVKCGAIFKEAVEQAAPRSRLMNGDQRNFCFTPHMFAIFVFVAGSNSRENKGESVVWWTDYAALKGQETRRELDTVSSQHA